jgi:hypothetical protein
MAAATEYVVPATHHGHHHHAVLTSAAWSPVQVRKLLPTCPDLLGLHARVVYRAVGPHAVYRAGQPVGEFADVEVEDR